MTAGRPAPARTRGKSLAFLLLAFVLVGVGALFYDLSILLWLAFFAPLVVVLAIRFSRGAPRALTWIGVGLGLLTVPVYALVGFDAVWAARLGHLDPIPSLVIGFLLVGAAAWVYLRPWWISGESKWAFAVAGGLALVLVVVPPAVFWVKGLIEGDGESLSQPPEAISRLDVVVLRDGADLATIAPATTRGWQVRTWIGQVGADEVDWGDGGVPPRTSSADVDRVLLLMVDGGPQQLDVADGLPDAVPETGDIERWLRLANDVTAPSTPTFAVLQTTDQVRLEAWRRALRGRPPAGLPARRRGNAFSLQEMAGDRSIVDIALRLGVFAGTADQDLALAAKHRPALFFDSDEPYPVPLSIDELLSSGKMRLCGKGQAVRTLCPEVRGSHDLNNAADHFAFDPEELAALTAQSTIYVHVTRSGNDHPEAIYLDYWWYLPYNPTGAGGGALCGAGFVLAGVTCFDHQSDWEGVTVVVDADSGRPTGVSYAQHNGVTRYTWQAANHRWRNSELPRPARSIDTTQRPLVFVAKGTHASYPTPCRSEKCSLAGVSLPEKRHDGGKSWPRDEANCQSVCVEALPTRGGGRRPARWNAFAGHWGTTNCVLSVACSTAEPPRSPGFQDRYGSPWCAGRSVSLTGGELQSTDTTCARREPTRTELAGGDRLLALGDSYSSGQGAGFYERNTTGDGNTCFRSSVAWPQLVADALDATPLASLACSGARIGEVTGNRTDGEIERRTSQVSRITSDPTIVTITIGGNDVGFADVLGKCVSGADCSRSYRSPSGRTLEEEITQVGERLPAVYRALRSAAPRARVVVVGYPRIFPAAAPTKSANCAAWDQITDEEVRYLNGATQALNAVIQQAADATHVEYVDVTEAFAGRELRCTGASLMNRLRLQTRLFPASFHPTSAGHAALAEGVAAALAQPASTE